MVNISRVENSIKFEFQDSQHYLIGNGEISVPLNSLQLVIDSSDMVTFKKLDGDPFVSFNIDESNFASKDALVEFYETEMVGGNTTSTNQAFPSGWTTTGTMEQLIEDINADDKAVKGNSYLSTVELQDLPAGLQQGELKVEIMDDVEGVGKVLQFTLTSADTPPYNWEYTSAYGQTGVWRSYADISQTITSISQLSQHAASGDSQFIKYTRADGTSGTVKVFQTRIGSGLRLSGIDDDLKLDDTVMSGYAATMAYDSSGHTIYLYNKSGETLSTIDATDFLTDGMLDSATVEDVVISGETQKCLVLVFNTDAGKDNINIPISELFDPSLVQCDEKIIEGCELIRKGTYTIRLNEGGAFGLGAIDAYDAPEDIEKTIYFKLNFDIVQNDAILLGIIGGTYGIYTYTNMCSDGNYLSNKGWYTLTNGDYENSAFVLLSIEDGQITNVSTVKSTFDEGDLTVINHGDYVEIKKWLRRGINANYNNELVVGVAFLASGETPSFNSEDCGVKWLNVPYDGISDDDLVNCIKFFSAYKIYPAESASERIDRIEDEIISKASAYTVNGVDDNGWSSGGLLYINQRNLNILGDECTIRTPFMKYDMNTIGYEDGKGLYSTMWILDIDKINEQTPDASISGGEVMQISSLQNAIFEFDLSQSTCGEINGELMSPSIEFGHFSVHLNENRFNFMAVSFDEETGEENWYDFEGKIVRKGNTVALEFNLDSPITDLEIEFYASGWNCDEEPELIEAKYYEDDGLEWTHIKIDEKLSTYDTAIDAINNEIDEKEEVISRTFYQLEDEISGLTESLGDKIDSSAITSSITSASTETEIPSAKAVYDAIGEGGGGLDEDFLQANANALYELKQEGKATNERFDSYYTKASSDGRYASNASIKKAYYDKAYVDDKLLAISASLNELNDDKQETLVAGNGISISGNVISAEGGGGAEYSAGTNIEITTANTINCTLPITYVSNSSELEIGTNTVSDTTGTYILGKNNTLKGDGLMSYISNCFVVGGDNTFSPKRFGSIQSNNVFGDRNILSGDAGNNNIIYGNGFNVNSGRSTAYYGFYGQPSASGNTSEGKIIIGDGYLDGYLQKHYHNCLEINKGNVYIVDTNDTSTQDYYSKPMMCLQDVIKDLTDRIAALESQLNT